MPRAQIASGTLLNAVATATTATSTSADLDTTGYERLTVIGRLAGTVTPADLTLVVNAYQPDGVVANIPVTPTASTAPASDGTDVVTMQSFDLRGISKVRVKATNANAASKNVTVGYFLQSFA